MRGNLGLILLLFSLLVGVAHRYHFAGFHLIDQTGMQIARLIGALGVAVCIVAWLRRMVGSSVR